MAPRVTRWHLATLKGPRAASAAELARHLPGASDVHEYESPAQAFAAAKELAGENDKIVVFGSFLTVGETIAWLNNNKTSTR
jgi:dihydrofolate synthase/folylpolyglutamate synthase